MTRVFYTTFTKIPMRKSAYETMCANPVPAAVTLNPPPPHRHNALTYSLLLTEHYRSFPQTIEIWNAKRTGVSSSFVYNIICLVLLWIV